MSRIASLAEGLEQPLLVTAALNLRYLTGFSSSNAALLVEPDTSATLYSDFRYAKRAREVDGVSFVETSRNRQMLVTYRFAGFRERERQGPVVLLESDQDSIGPLPDYVVVIDRCLATPSPS